MSNTLLANSARNILREALISEFGIAVEVVPRGDINSPTLRAKQILYRFKNEDAEFEGLQIRLSPNDPDRELWIVKKE